MLDYTVFLDKLIVALLLISQKILKNLCVDYPTVSSPPVNPYTEPLKSNPRPYKQLFMAEFNIILSWKLKYSKVPPKFRPHNYRFFTFLSTKVFTNFDILDLLNQMLSMPIFKYPFLVTFPVLGSNLVTEDKDEFVSVHAMKARGEQRSSSTHS